MSKSDYKKVVEAMKILEKYPKEREMYESIQTEEFLQRISENNIRKESEKIVFSKGKDAGIIEEKKETAKQMLKNNFTVAQIKSVTKLTEEEILEIKNKI